MTEIELWKLWISKLKLNWNCFQWNALTQTVWVKTYKRTVMIIVSPLCVVQWRLFTREFSVKNFHKTNLVEEFLLSSRRNELRGRVSLETSSWSGFLLQLVIYNLYKLIYQQQLVSSLKGQIWNFTIIDYLFVKQFRHYLPESRWPSLGHVHNDSLTRDCRQAPLLTNKFTRIIIGN